MADQRALGTSPADARIALAAEGRPRHTPGLVAPACEIAFQDGNPLKLTVEGEFVIKNLVLLSAGLVVGSMVHRDRETITPT